MNDSLNRILLATDGSAGAEFAARTAIRLANDTGCELHLVYVERLPGSSANVPISVRHIEGELQERAEREGLGWLLDLDGRLRTAGDGAPVPTTNDDEVDLQLFGQGTHLFRNLPHPEVRPGDDAASGPQPPVQVQEPS
jgi:nucleotide-binding universal stress UspA family protein